MTEPPDWDKIAREICRSENVDSAVEDEVLQALASITNEPTIPSTSLLVRRLKVSGMLELDREFSDGINLIVGPNFAGKSTVLDLIKYSFVGKTKLIDEEIRPKIEEILMEVDLGQDTFTVRRTLQRRQNGIYEGSISEVMAGSASVLVERVAEFMPFFMERLSYPQLSKLASKRGDVAKTTRQVGFGDFYRAFYQDQSRGYSELFSRESFETRQHVFNVLIGATNSRLSNRARIRYGELENRLQIEQHSLQSFLQFIAAKGKRIVDETDGEKAINKVRVKLVEAETALKKATDDLPSMVEASVDSSSTQAADDEEKLTLVVGRKRELTQVLAEQEQALADFKLQEKALEKQKVAGRILQSYYPILCPRCTQGIPDEWVEREDNHGECRVCHRDAPTAPGVETVADAALEEIRQSIAQVVKDRNETEHDLAVAQAEWEALEQRAKAQVKGATQPIASAVRTAHDTLRNLEADVERWRARLTELESDHDYLQSQRRRLEAMRAEIRVWKQLEDRAISNEKSDSYGNPYTTFARHVSQFLDNLKKAHRGQVSLDPRGLLSIGGTTFDDFRPGEKARACIAVFYGLLKMSIENDGRLPRFLAIDSPRQQEMDLEDYETIARMYQELAESAAKRGTRMQVIIATASGGLDGITDEDRKWVLTGDEKTLKASSTVVSA